MTQPDSGLRLWFDPHSGKMWARSRVRELGTRLLPHNGDEALGEIVMMLRRQRIGSSRTRLVGGAIAPAAAIREVAGQGFCLAIASQPPSADPIRLVAALGDIFAPLVPDAQNLVPRASAALAAILAIHRASPHRSQLVANMRDVFLREADGVCLELLVDLIDGGVPCQRARVYAAAGVDASEALAIERAATFDSASLGLLAALRQS